MIRIKLKAEPFWLDIGGGASFYVKPPTTTLLETARSHVRREVEMVKEASDRLKAVGATISNIPDLGDGAVLLGHTLALLPEAVAKYAAMDWKGIGDEEGVALPFTPENLSRAMKVDVIARSFLAQYLETIAEVDAEKNASAPAPSGSLGTGATIAPDAAPPSREAAD